MFDHKANLRHKHRIYHFRSAYSVVYIFAGAGVFIDRIILYGITISCQIEHCATC